MNDASRAHTTAFLVRDYECDLQGVVNNAVYLNYLEHARHEFLKSRGLDFAAITASGIRLVVARAELDYHASLTSGDNFHVHTSFAREGRLKFLFRQHVIRDSDGKKMLSATITAAALNEQGRPFDPGEVLEGLY